VPIGSNFTGAAVPVAPTWVDFSFVHASNALGGKFDPSNTAQYGFDRPDPVDLIGISLDLADQSTWKVEKVSADGTVVSLIASGTTEPGYEETKDFRVTLLWGQYIAVTTTGTITAAMKAELTFEPHVV